MLVMSVSSFGPFERRLFYRLSVVETALMAFDVSTMVPVNAIVRNLFCVVDRIPAAPSNAMTGNTVEPVS
jgi:hypothetical protein